MFNRERVNALATGGARTSGVHRMAFVRASALPLIGDDSVYHALHDCQPAGTRESWDRHVQRWGSPSAVVRPGVTVVTCVFATDSQRARFSGEMRSDLDVFPSIAGRIWIEQRRWSEGPVVAVFLLVKVPRVRELTVLRPGIPAVWRLFRRCPDLAPYRTVEEVSLAGYATWLGSRHSLLFRQFYAVTVGFDFGAVMIVADRVGLLQGVEQYSSSFPCRDVDVPEDAISTASSSECDC